MKPALIPRSLIILMLVLVAVTFLAGTLHAFGSASAAVPAIATPGGPAVQAAHLTPTPIPNQVSVPGDTTGIIALAIVIVLVVLGGATFGGARPRKKKPS